MSHAGPGLLSPGAPQLGEGPGRLLLWQPGSKPQARDDPTLLFRAIQLHQCTEKALFDLSIKFYSFFFLKKKILFLEEQGGKSGFKGTLLSYFPCGSFIPKGITVHLQQISIQCSHVRSSSPLGAASAWPCWSLHKEATLITVYLLLYQPSDPHHSLRSGTPTSLQV